MAFNGANFTLTGDIGWSCSCLDPGRAVTGSWCGMARWALGRVVAAAEPPGAGAGARSQLHRCYGNLGAIPGESQKSTAKLTSSWQAAPRAVGPRLAEGCLIYGKYSRGFQELSHCTRWRGSWWHGGDPDAGVHGHRGQHKPWHQGFVSPRLAQGQRVPVAAGVTVPITAASVGAETGQAQRWETREEMPGPARP